MIRRPPRSTRSGPRSCPSCRCRTRCISRRTSRRAMSATRETTGPEDSMTMPRGRSQRGVAFAYLGITLFALVGLTGLAVDLGRSYVIKTNLSKAVDAAALAAARTIGAGQSAARDEANKIFNVNFRNGYLGVTSVQNPPQIAFSVAADDSKMINVSLRAGLPATFMPVFGVRDIKCAP